MPTSADTQRLRNPSSYSSREDIAWLAGFYEGEGYIHALGAGITGYGVHFTQVDPEPIVKVHALCGGTVRIRKARATSRKPTYELAIFGQRAIAVVEAIYPHLSTRRRRQIDAMRAQDRQRKTTNRWGQRLALTPIPEG